MTNTDTETDWRIIRAVQQGDRDAFAELYDRYHQKLMAIAYRILLNKRDAEDLLHDVFLEVWKKAASYDPDRGTLSCWLGVKIRSRALDRLRTLNRAIQHEREQSGNEVELEMPANEVSRMVDHCKAKKTLEQLNPTQRTVIELSYFRGFTCQEIANHCQMPLGTVKSGLLRGLQVLRREFNYCEGSGTCK